MNLGNPVGPDWNITILRDGHSNNPESAPVSSHKCTRLGLAGSLSNRRGLAAMVLPESTLPVPPELRQWKNRFNEVLQASIPYINSKAPKCSSPARTHSPTSELEPHVTGVFVSQGEF